MTLQERINAVAEMQKIDHKLCHGFELMNDNVVEEIYQAWITQGKPTKEFFVKPTVRL